MTCPLRTTHVSYEVSGSLATQPGSLFGMAREQGGLVSDDNLFPLDKQ